MMRCARARSGFTAGAAGRARAAGFAFAVAFFTGFAFLAGLAFFTAFFFTTFFAAFGEAALRPATLVFFAFVFFVFFATHDPPWRLRYSRLPAVVKQRCAAGGWGLGSGRIKIDRPDL